MIRQPALNQLGARSRRSGHCVFRDGEPECDGTSIYSESAASATHSSAGAPSARSSAALPALRARVSPAGRSAARSCAPGAAWRRPPEERARAHRAPHCPIRRRACRAFSAPPAARTRSVAGALDGCRAVGRLPVRRRSSTLATRRRISSHDLEGLRGRAEWQQQLSPYEHGREQHAPRRLLQGLSGGLRPPARPRAAGCNVQETHVFGRLELALAHSSWAVRCALILSR